MHTPSDRPVQPRNERVAPVALSAVLREAMDEVQRLSRALHPGSGARLVRDLKRAVARLAELTTSVADTIDVARGAAPGGPRPATTKPPARDD
jgi:hypothetical protein